MPTPARGRGFRPSVAAYHHLIAVIEAAIATIALIINSAISNAVGFSFRFFFFISSQENHRVGAVVKTAR